MRFNISQLTGRLRTIAEAIDKGKKGNKNNAIDTFQEEGLFECAAREAYKRGEINGLQYHSIFALDSNAAQRNGFDVAPADNTRVAIPKRPPVNSIRELYNSLGLEKEGLSYEIFALAMKGYNNLKDKGNGRLGIIDPYKKKYYLIDMKNKKFIEKTDVKLGNEAESISAANKLGSGATLSGFEKVKNEYPASKKTWSTIGIRREGLESGINDMSMQKGTVIHSIRGNRTLGCIGITPVYKNGKQDDKATDAKLRRLFTPNTILFTYPTNVDEYKRLSKLV